MPCSRLTWETKFELGVEEIDLQHRYFLGLVNRVSAELDHHYDQPYLLALFNELNAYARFHFISEENMMLKAGYPNLEAHRHHHRELIDQLNAREWKLRTRPSDEEASNLVAFLKQWFLSHTTREDKQFAEFLKAR